MSGQRRFAASDARVTRSVGDEHMASEVMGSLASDCGDMGCRLRAVGSSISRGLLATNPGGRAERGVKNLPKRRGVTDGFRLSFRRPVRDGDRNGPAGEEDIAATAAVAEAGGLEGTVSVYGP